MEQQLFIGKALNTSHPEAYLQLQQVPEGRTIRTVHYSKRGNLMHGTYTAPWVIPHTRNERIKKVNKIRAIRDKRKEAWKALMGAL